MKLGLPLARKGLRLLDAVEGRQLVRVRFDRTQTAEEAHAAAVRPVDAFSWRRSGHDATGAADRRPISFVDCILLCWRSSHDVHLLLVDLLPERAIFLLAGVHCDLFAPVLRRKIQLQILFAVSWVRLVSHPRRLCHVSHRFDLMASGLHHVQGLDRDRDIL